MGLSVGVAFGPGCWPACRRRPRPVSRRWPHTGSRCSSSWPATAMPPCSCLAPIAAVPLDAAELRIALTGCAVAADAAHARQPGDDWLVVPDGERDLYLHRD